MKIYQPLTDDEKANLKNGDVVYIMTSYGYIKGVYPNILNEETLNNFGTSIEENTKRSSLFKAMDINFRDEFGTLLERIGLKGDAVEIGVAEGRNARVLISQPAIEKLYLIDNWEHLEQAGDGGHPQSWHDTNYKETQERVLPWKEKAVLLKGMSGDMIKQIPDDSLIFAYIDCDHSEKGFTKDLLAILPKIKTGGVVAGHDVLNPSYGVGIGLKKWIDANGYTRDDVRFTVENGDNSMVSFWFIKK